MEIFYKKWKKFNVIKLTKNKMDLNISKITNHPPSPILNVCHVYLVFQHRHVNILIKIFNQFDNDQIYS